MKILLQTKRGLNTLKFGACSEILTLILGGKLKLGTIITLFYYSFGKIGQMMVSNGVIGAICN